MDTADKTPFGFWVYIMSDCVLFAALFATYAVLRGETYGGLTIQNLTDLQYVLGETLFLLTSSFTMGLSLLAAHRNKTNLLIGGLGATLLLGASFVGMEGREFWHLIVQGAGPSHSAFLSSYFALVGTHGLHVMLGLLWILILLIAIGVRGLTEGNKRKLVSVGLFWHFLDIVWIFIFTFVYLLGTL